MLYGPEFTELEGPMFPAEELGPAAAIGCQNRPIGGSCNNTTSAVPEEVGGETCQPDQGLSILPGEHSGGLRAVDEGLARLTTVHGKGAA